MRQLVNLNKAQVGAVCRELGEDFVGFSLLASGYHNDTFLLETKGNKYILRVQQKRVTENILKDEYENIKSLKRGMGPKVYLFDSSHEIIPTDFLVEEFVEGEHPKPKATNEFIIAMAKWMKRLHSIKSSIEDREGYFSLSSAIKDDRNDFDRYKYTLPGKLAAELEALFDSAVALCSKNETLFRNYKKYSLLHSDYWPGNIFIKNNKIRVIDWEFSGDGVPEWDIVYFLNGYKMNIRQKRLFLRTYGYPNNPIAKERLKMIELLIACHNIWDSVWQLDHLIKKDSDAYAHGLKKNLYLQRLRGCKKQLIKLI
jgi:thiamine kinase-like enzyme